MPFSMIVPPAKIKTGKLTVSCSGRQGSAPGLMISIPRPVWLAACGKAERCDIHIGQGDDAGKLLVAPPQGGGRPFQADLFQDQHPDPTAGARLVAGLQDRGCRLRAPAEQGRAADRPARMGLRQAAADGDPQGPRPGRARAADRGGGTMITVTGAAVDLRGIGEADCA
jgi:hypothetical protein